MPDTKQENHFVAEANLHVERLWNLHDTLATKPSLSLHFALLEKIGPYNRKLYVIGYQDLLDQYRRKKLGEPQRPTTLIAAKSFLVISSTLSSLSLSFGSFSDLKLVEC